MQLKIMHFLSLHNLEDVINKKMRWNIIYHYMNTDPVKSTVGPCINNSEH